MKIYVGNSESRIRRCAQKADSPTFRPTILSDVYGMRVTNCVVRDGLNWGEQPLINNEGYGSTNNNTTTNNHKNNNNDSSSNCRVDDQKSRNQKSFERLRPCATECQPDWSTGDEH